MMESIEADDLTGITDRLSNVLETVTEKKYPIITKIKNAMLESGAMNSLMSGSGPTVFGIYADKESAQNGLSKVREIEMVRNSFIVEPIDLAK